MAEESKIVLSSEDKSLGTIQISPRVLLPQVKSMVFQRCMVHLQIA